MAHDDLQRPEGAADDWTIPQDWDGYTPAEHAMWDTLFERQAKMLPGCIAPLRTYGAGIVSSYAESIYCLDDPSPNRLGFDLKHLMRTNYRINDYQQIHFVIDSFESLLKTTLETDFAPLYEELAGQPDLDPPAVLPEDPVYALGTQAYARMRATA